MNVRKVLTAVSLVMVVQLVMTSCSGGHVSNNGLFENGHKVLKQSLVGSWRVVKMERGLVGEEFYEFCKVSGKVILKVNGEERAIERFDSADGLSFTFEYVDDMKKRIYVVGQFKSNAREMLMLLEEPMDALHGKLTSPLTLERRMKKTETVVAKSSN